MPETDVNRPLARADGTTPPEAASGDTVAAVPRATPVPRDRPMPALGRALWRAGPPLIRGVAKLTFSYRVETLAPLPAPPFVVAANHYSHFDPPVIGAALRTTVRYLALDELADASRFLAWVLPTFGTIPLSHSASPIGPLRVALASLSRGEVVGLFPEGTRVARWGDREPKRGAAWLACKAGAPLVPVAVIGTDQVLGIDNRLRRGAIRVVIGRAMDPDGADPTSLTADWLDWVNTHLRDRSVT